MTSAHAPSTPPASDTAGVPMEAPSREGHRPLLTPAEALFLAQELYGIQTCCPSGSGDGNTAPAAPAVGAAIASEAVAAVAELPSYDDRNFRITGRRQQRGPQEQRLRCQEGQGAQAAAAVPEQTGEEEPLVVVLKVHNTQDSGRTDQLKAMDEAMQRLQTAGVTTNTALRPVGPAVAARGSSDGVATDGGDAGGEVPYRVATQAMDEQGQDGEEQAPSAACCWAYLPCTCHPPPELDPAAAGASASAASGRASQEGEEANASTANSETGPRHWHVVRCLTYVPGQMLSSVPYLTPALLLSLGRLLGRVSSGLAGWDPPALRRCSHDWYPENGAQVLRRLVPAIGAFDEERKSLLLCVADELAAAGSRLADPGQLPRQVCHADANDDNCVVSGDGREVVGLIDFGDMAVMPRVCEVSIAMLYAMLLGLNRPMGQPTSASAAAERSAAGAAMAVPADQSMEEQEEDGATLRRLLRVAGLVLRGFRALVRLESTELAVLPLLLRGRLAQSLALGASSVVADPGNAGYLLATQRPGWRVFRLLTRGSVMTDEEMVTRMVEVEDEETEA